MRLASWDTARAGFLLLCSGFFWLSSCARALENAPCPCEEAYACCEVDNRCYPRGQACGAKDMGSAQGGHAAPDEPNASGGSSAFGSGGISSAGGVGTPSGGAGGAGSSSTGEAGQNAGGSSGSTAAGGGVSAQGGAAGQGHAGGDGGAGGESGDAEGGESGASSEPPFTLVATQHNDNARTGANLNESTLAPSSVESSRFGELSRRPLRGAVFAQPLVAPDVAVDAERRQNLVYVATMANVVYALDAERPAAAPTWTRELGAPVQMPDAAFNAGTGNIWYEIGVLGTPVLSPSEGALYVVSVSKAESGQVHRLHKLALSDGAQLNSVTIEHAGFESANQAQWSALSLSNGILYVPFGGYSAAASAKGWVFTYDTGLSPLGAVELHEASGVTMGGQGPASDEDGRIYFTTNRLPATPATETSVFGSRLLELGSPSAPSLTERLFPGASDVGTNELGSSGPLLIPNTTRLLVAGQSRMYLVDRNASAGSPPVQEFRASSSGSCSLGQPLCSDEPMAAVFWPGSGTAPQARAFVWSANDLLRALPFDPVRGLFDCQSDPCPALSSSATGDSGDEQNHVLKSPANLSVSSNGSESGSGIVWAVHPFTENHWRNPEWILRAFAAEGLAHLWSSEAARTPIGPLAPTAIPTVSGGRVFVGTAEGLTNKHTFVSDTSGGPPAVTNFGDEFLVTAWGYVSSISSRGIQLAWSDDGVDFLHSSRVADDFLAYEPALASDGASRIFLAWTASTGSIKVRASGNPSFDISELLTQQVPGGTPVSLKLETNYPPALAYGGNRLFLAWHDERDLHVISSPDGVSFDLSSLVTIPGYTSDAAPLLAYVNGRVYLASTSRTKQTSLFVSSDDAANFAEPVLLPIESAGHPFLFASAPEGAGDPEFHVMWAGADLTDNSSGDIWIASATAGDLGVFRRIHRFVSDQAEFSVAGAQFRGGSYVAWIGTDRRPNVARYTPGELVTYGLKAD